MGPNGSNATLLSVDSVAIPTTNAAPNLGAVNPQTFKEVLKMKTRVCFVHVAGDKSDDAKKVDHFVEILNALDYDFEMYDDDYDVGHVEYSDFGFIDRAEFIARVVDRFGVDLGNYYAVNFWNEMREYLP